MLKKQPTQWDKDGAYLSDPKVRRVFVASYIVKQCGHEADPIFIRDVTGTDPYEALFKNQAISSEIFDLQNHLQVRSVLFSSYIVDNFFDPKEFLTALEPLISISTIRRDELSFRRMSGALMQVSFLSRIFANLPNRDEELKNLFERLRNNDAVNAEPLFWLQYAILMSDKDITISENFISTAYERAKARKGFLTYQIDTFALRLALRAESVSIERTVSRFDYIVEKLNLVIEMIGEPSHRFYAISVLNDLEPFTRSRTKYLTTHQKNRLVYDLSRAITALESLSPEYRAQSGSDAVKSSMLAAKDHLLK